jgi:hypothetical protein
MRPRSETPRHSSSAGRRPILVALISLIGACGGGASKGGGGGNAGGTAGSPNVAGNAGASGGADVQDGGGDATGGGAGGAGDETGDAAGAAGGANPGSAGTGFAAGASGAAGSGGTAGTDATTGVGGTGGVLATGAGGGTFVMCDDHADFNGRGLCAPTGKFGAVVATQLATAAGTTTTLTASFAAAKPTTDPGCTQESLGAACVAVTCPAGAPLNPAGPEAGAITAKSNGGSIVTKPDASGAYDLAGLAGPLWSQPMAALTFTAAGGAVPAFSETFCGPVPATITKPAAVPGAGLTIDRTNDLAVQWTGGAVGDLEVIARDDGAGVELRCFFTGSDGQGTIPKAALAKIGAGAHTLASFLWVRKISLPQGTCVELTGVNTNVGAASAPWNGVATFQ